MGMESTSKKGSDEMSINPQSQKKIATLSLTKNGETKMVAVEGKGAMMVMTLTVAKRMAKATALTQAKIWSAQAKELGVPLFVYAEKMAEQGKFLLTEEMIVEKWTALGIVEGA